MNTRSLMLHIIVYQVSEQTKSAWYVSFFLQENNTVASFAVKPP